MKVIYGPTSEYTKAGLLLEPFIAKFGTAGTGFQKIRSWQLLILF